MQLNPFAPYRNRTLLAAACLFLPFSARAGETPIRDLLRDGLYAEEVARDPEAAAKQYEQVLALYAGQRDFAASALFRLAEVRRKQNRKEDAVKLYQRLLTEFPAAESETRLARENLAALGGKEPETQTAAVDEEAKKLAKLEAAAKSSPDLLLAPGEMEYAAGEGWMRVVKFLLAHGGKPFADNALGEAARSGNLEMLKLLTAGDEPVPVDAMAAAITEAVDGHRLVVLEYLLEKDFKPGTILGRNFRAPAVAYALLSGSEANIPCAEILLKHGADPDAMFVTEKLRSDDPCGTALYMAVEKQNFVAANWLLDHGAKADIPAPEIGLTPLHCAVYSGKDECIAMIGRLLAAGADPNRRSLAMRSRHLIMASALAEATPLEIAFDSNFKKLEKIKPLLEHGANPNVVARENTSFSTPAPLIAEAAVKGYDGIVKLLLGAGADLDFMECRKNLLFHASQAEDEDAGLRAVTLLADAGATFDESWAWQGYNQAKNKSRRYLTDRFVIPKLAGGDEINLLVEQGGALKTVKMATKQAGAHPPDLAAWLLANHGSIRRAAYQPDSGDYLWLVHRKNGDGSMEKLEFDFGGSKPFPELRWGDLVEFKLRPLQPSVKSFTLEFPDGFTPEMTWSLRQRISFPVTVEIEGKSREIRLRGNLLLFDPTKEEMPLVSAHDLVGFLMPTGNFVPLGRGAIVDDRVIDKNSAPNVMIVSRTGWPDVRLEDGSLAAAKFQLESGDRVKVEVSEDFRNGLEEFRKRNVTIQVAGFPYVLGLTNGRQRRKSAPLVPSLVQALVETQVPRVPDWSLLAAPGVKGGKMMSRVDVFRGFSLLPHPDLARIRIRRLLEEGKETVLEIDLAKAISATSENTTPDEARKGDVILQWGDVIEISLKNEMLGKPWKGFSADEKRFISKVLSGRVQVTDRQGNVTVRDLDFQAPEFIDADATWIPMPAGSGLPGVRGWQVLGNSNGTLKRGDIEMREMSSAFLRDGDLFVEEPGNGRTSIPPLQSPSR